MLVVLLTVLALAASQTIELYRAQNRPAAELVAIAESALGPEGQVTLDARTATLVLNGTPQAVRRALDLLRRMDRPLKQIVLESEIVGVEELRALDVAVDWRVSIGSVRIGTVPMAASAVRARLDLSRSRERSRSRSVLRLIEGGSGTIRTGEAFPVLFDPYWGTTGYAFVETGFEAQVRLVGDDEIHLELRPFAGRVGADGGLRYVAAATAVSVASGETVVLAETFREAESSTSSPAAVRRERDRDERVLLLTVDASGVDDRPDGNQYDFE